MMPLTVVFEHNLVNDTRIGRVKAHAVLGADTRHELSLVSSVVALTS